MGHALSLDALRCVLPMSLSPLLVLMVFVATSFAWFGTSCLVTAAMRGEFERYALARFRVLIGVLQLCGAVGLTVGWWYRPLGVAAAVGLTVLMLLGWTVRRRIRDPWLKQIPAGVYAGLSAVLAWGLWPR